MKKIVNLLLVLILVLISSSAFADYDCRYNGTPCPSNPITGINFTGPTTAQGGTFLNQTGLRKTVPVLDQNLAAIGVAQGDYTSVPSTTTAVPVGFAFIRKVIPSNGDAAFTAGTLANGFPGQVITIYVAGLSPSGATTGGNYTITPTKSLGFSSIKVSAVGDIVTLLYLDNTWGWTIGNLYNGASNSITVTLKA